jgi:V8-like Glu-specific endopeptidase
MRMSRRLLFLAALLAGLAAAAQAATVPEDVLSGRVGKLVYPTKGGFGHCTVFAVAGTLVTAGHCLPASPAARITVAMDYAAGRAGRVHYSHAADWRRLPVRDAALLCDALPAEIGLTAAAPALTPGSEVVVAGYGEPDIQRRSETACPVGKPPALGLLHLACPVTPGSSGAPVMIETGAGWQAAGVMFLTSDFYSVAELIDAAAIRAACEGKP